MMKTYALNEVWSYGDGDGGGDDDAGDAGDACADAYAGMYADDGYVSELIYSYRKIRRRRRRHWRLGTKERKRGWMAGDMKLHFGQSLLIPARIYLGEG